MAEPRPVRVRVRCTLVVEYIERPAPGVFASQEDFERVLRFQIEENSCPGTSSTGAEVERVIKARGGLHGSACWACAMDGENEILELEAIDG